MVDARTPPAVFARRFPACIFSRAGAGRRAPAGPRNFAIAVECSAMQGYAKQRSYIFVYTWPSMNGCRLSVLRECVAKESEHFRFRTKIVMPHILQPINN